MHPNNKHISGYDLKKLSKVNPVLKQHIITNPYNKETIDFSDPNAVFELNKGLLLADYKLKYWNTAPNSLCPAVPGRADYIHHLAELLAQDNNGTIPTGPGIKILDIGTGSSLIYPIIGAQEYEWSFVASDIDNNTLNYAETNINKNTWLKKKIQLRFQADKSLILEGIILPTDKFNAILCNPPFFKSREDNWQKSTKKFKNLHKGKDIPTVQNFKGHPNELWYEGGEKAFVTKLVYESLKYKDQLGWITSLIADKEHLKPLKAVLEYHKASEIQVISMKQGQKITRILCWKW